MTVPYQPVQMIQDRYGYRKKGKGSTREMAARALYWFLKSKFDAIEYGIEEFDVAFMPHLITQIGWTIAEQPQLIEQMASAPESIARLALPAPIEARA